MRAGALFLLLWKGICGAFCCSVFCVLAWENEIDQRAGDEFLGTVKTVPYKKGGNKWIT